MQHCRYELLIFDLDGTLLDTGEGIRAALRHTIKELGYPVPTDKTLSAYIGPPIEQAFADLCGLEGEALQEAAKQFRIRYSTHELLTATPYAGIFDLLGRIRALGAKLAIATYKREDYAKKLLRHYGFHHYAPIMHGSDANGFLKKKDIIRLCIEECGAPAPKSTVMVGDTAEDARGAEAAGTDFIAVTYGFGFRTARDALPYAPTAIACSPMELLPYFLKEDKT